MAIASVHLEAHVAEHHLHSWVEKLPKFVCYFWVLVLPSEIYDNQQLWSNFETEKGSVKHKGRKIHANRVSVRPRQFDYVSDLNHEVKNDAQTNECHQEEQRIQPYSEGIHGLSIQVTNHRNCVGNQDNDDVKG